MTPICHLYSINVLYSKNMMKLTSQLHHSVFFHNHLCLSLFTQHLLLICYISSKCTCYQENVTFWLENSIVEKNKKKQSTFKKKKKSTNQSAFLLINSCIELLSWKTNTHSQTHLHVHIANRALNVSTIQEGTCVSGHSKKKKKKLT